MNKLKIVIFLLLFNFKDQANKLNIFKIELNNGLTNKEINNLKKIWGDIKEENEKLIIYNSKLILLKSKTQKYLCIKKLIKKIEQKQYNVKIRIKIGVTKFNKINAFGINQFGIYNKNKSQHFDFRGLGAVLQDFPTPTNGKIAIESYNLNLIPSSFDNVFLSSVSLTSGGNNLSKQRYDQFIQLENLSFNSYYLLDQEICVKNKSSHKLSSNFLIPIYSLNSKINQNNEVTQTSAINYVQQGISLKITPIALKNNKIHLTTFLEVTNLANYSKESILKIANEGILYPLMLGDPPIFDNITLFNKVTINHDESLMLIANKNTNIQNNYRASGFPFLDKLKKIFTATTNDDTYEYSFILITPEIVRD